MNGFYLLFTACLIVSWLPVPIRAADSAIEASPETLSATKYEFSADDEKLLDAIEKGCFQYLWNEVGKPSMLAKDKTSDTICSTAAVGFQFSSLPIGVERGWITKQEGEDRAKTVLHTLVDRHDKKSTVFIFTS